jgi:hypothetical protein
MFDIHNILHDTANAAAMQKKYLPTAGPGPQHIPVPWQPAALRVNLLADGQHDIHRILKACHGNQRLFFRFCAKKTWDSLVTPLLKKCQGAGKFS